MAHDYRLALMCGVDIPIPECQLTAHQPTLEDIAYLGETNFFMGAQCLCVHKTMVTSDESLLAQMNNFQVFMTVMAEKSLQDKRQTVIDVLQLLFPDYKVNFTPMSMIFSKDDNTILVDEKNFESLQDVLENIFCFKSGASDQTTFNPANEQARKIADKLMRGRQRVAAQNENSIGSVLSRYISVLTIGSSNMSIDKTKKLTLFQLYDLIERYHLYLAWDMDIKVRLAGGKPDGRTEDWMKNMH